MGITANKYPLNGSWIPVKQEFAGKAFPESAFKSYKLVMQDSIYTYGSANTDMGSLYYEQGKMDIYGRAGVNQGKHFMALYKREKDTMTICYNLKGDSYPTDFATIGKPMHFLSVYKLDTTK